MYLAKLNLVEMGIFKNTQLDNCLKNGHAKLIYARNKDKQIVPFMLCRDNNKFGIYEVFEGGYA